jgi:hypothetical protein
MDFTLLSITFFKNGKDNLANVYGSVKMKRDAGVEHDNGKYFLKFSKTPKLPTYFPRQIREVPLATVSFRKRRFAIRELYFE